MNDKVSSPLSLSNIQINDRFWKKEIELVRTEVIPYQWDALNDQVEGASPSFCMRNFKVAGKMAEKRKEMGKSYIPPTYTFRGFEALPEDPANPDPDKFYGFVFQDTDFSKWIEAVGYSLTQHPDPVLEQTADEAIDIVCAAQQEDGYLDTYYIINGRDKSFTNLRDHHELYCLGHLIEGAIAYYQATKKDKLLKAAMKFADYVCTIFGPEEGKCKGYPGHEIVEMALFKLYEVTKIQKYYDLSKFFIEERGQRPYYFDKEEHPDVIIKGHETEERYQYNQAHKPVLDQKEATGHAVRAMYLYSAMADFARIGQDSKMQKACETLFDNVVEKQMYITGGVGSSHIGEAFTYNYDLPSDTAYAETCASIGMAFFCRRMLEITPSSKYADVLEREVYNGILSGMALDGKSFFYVNPLDVNPKSCHKDQRKFHVKPVRQKWFGCACCPPNLARFISSIGLYAFTETDSSLFVHLYIGANIVKRMGDVNIDISIDSNFPWEGKSTIIIKNAPKNFKLALRIPDWAENNYSLSGFTGDISFSDGYIYLSKDWSDTEEVSIEFPMNIRIMEANTNVRELAGKVAVQRGPLVYCMEEKDNGKDLHLLSLPLDSDKNIQDIIIQNHNAKALHLMGKRQIPSSSSALYATASKSKYEDTDITLIPYYMWANRGENEMTVWINRSL